MGIKRISAAVAVFAGAGLCATGPMVKAVKAEVPTAMDGVYAYADEDGVTATWIIRTACTPGCVAHVTTGPGRGFDAPLVDGHYTVTRTVPEGAVCPSYTLGDNGSWFDGGTHPVTVTQWWDPLTFVGEVDFLDSPAPCGLGDWNDHFTLTRLS